MIFQNFVIFSLFFRNYTIIIRIVKIRAILKRKNIYGRIQLNDYDCPPREFV